MSRSFRSRTPNAQQSEGPHRRMAPFRSLGLELGWTIGPAVVILAIAVSTVLAVLAADPPGEPSAPVLVPVPEQLPEAPAVLGSPEDWRK